MKILRTALIIVISLSLLITILVTFLVIKQRNLFDVDSFNKRAYTIDEIAFFEDIAFWDSLHIKKWETDIKVQIDTTDKVSESDIKEVDNVINILSPLIAPLKITRVATGGNLIVHLNYPNQTNGRATGWAVINDMSKPVSINHADVYVLKNYNQNIMHEFLHALGLWHPQKEYPFHTAIGRNNYVILENQDKQVKYPDHFIKFNTWEEFDEFSVKTFNNLSEQEKKVIKMLYSSDIKSGLTKRYFMYRMRR